ncbi:MAG: 2-C-methyl-D-erythritol 2,4-cyclodiphosphate synthase [Gammaproteobacteria bacterium]|nr:2-C-methyl-D-erythritol 2,4-cyclodiphosphate synthase [Gammaproteobacteria bacterium]
MKVGQGYDVHALDVPGSASAIRLGGTDIPFDRAIIAHSDGDVLIHALCDAILGALAIGDIGSHFPDSDAAYTGIDSRKLLVNVAERARSMGYIVANADTTAIAERPKLAPFVEQIRAVLATDLAVDPGCVSVKATTTERLGFIGRGEGIAAQAIVLLRPSS